MPEEQLAVPRKQGPVKIKQGDARGRYGRKLGRHGSEHPTYRENIQAFCESFMAGQCPPALYPPIHRKATVELHPMDKDGDQRAKVKITIAWSMVL